MFSPGFSAGLSRPILGSTYTSNQRLCNRQVRYLFWKNLLRVRESQCPRDRPPGDIQAATTNSTCRALQAALFYLGLGLWPWNFQLFADGPNCLFLYFATGRDVGDLGRGRKPGKDGTFSERRMTAVRTQPQFQAK
jgi:hypothetical protein